MDEEFGTPLNTVFINWKFDLAFAGDMLFCVRVFLFLVFYKRRVKPR